MVDFGSGAVGASYFARDAAVGAVSREEMSNGFVVSRDLGFGADDGFAAVDGFLSAAAARATEAAVGAVNELRDGFLVGTFGDKTDAFEAVDAARGDFTELVDGLGALLVATAVAGGSAVV